MAGKWTGSVGGASSAVMATGCRPPSFRHRLRAALLTPLISRESIERTLAMMQVSEDPPWDPGTMAALLEHLE